MRNRCLILLLLVLFAANASAQVRERMVYTAKLGFVKGGEAEMVVSDTIYNEENLTHYFIRGYSTGVTKLVYDVNDIYETIFDNDSIKPYFHIRNVKENRYRFYNETTFSQTTDSICSTKSGCSLAPVGMLDALTFYAKMRKAEFIDTLEVGEQFTQVIYHANKHFSMSCTYVGKETIKTIFGETECYVISPIIEDSKLVSGSDALKFFITADENRVPVVLELALSFGKVKGELVSYTKSFSTD